ncbi:MAG: DUF58 domain-containing protein [Rhizobiaceae bacterium]|jgi:uncharacterized protein (DUF58 family)|nr:DUF58 domain-containing protein [Rhizobiaceae bacterium]
MTALGARVQRGDRATVLARSRARAALLPDLLVEARRIANIITPGWHGRRRRGIGEEFWQYRPYAPGETVARIDWRRSARDEHIYVRDLEWQAAHTVWLWADPSPSMLFQSRGATISKESRALVIVLALAELLSRSGERIAYPGAFAPTASRLGAERLAASLYGETALADQPDLSHVGGASDLVIVSDFLDEPEAIEARFAPLAARGTRVHFVEVADPVEESFPYAGRTEFLDPETGEKLTAGRAETIAAEYRALYLARREALSRFAQTRGWTHTVTHTDALASAALVRLFGLLSGEGSA